MRSELGHRGADCAGFLFIYGSASLGWKGRAFLKPVNGAIPAGRISFKPDEPEHGANRA